MVRKVYNEKINKIYNIYNRSVDNLTAVTKSMYMLISPHLGYDSKEKKNREVTTMHHILYIL